MESFYMTLQSKHTPHYYPLNSGADYTVKLPKPFKFSPNSFEVGVSEFYFTLPEPPKDENGNYIKGKPSFFGKVENDNTIKVKGHSQSGFTMTKTSPEVIMFAKDLENELEWKNYGIRIVLDVVGTEQRIAIENYGVEKVSLVIPEDLAEVFGFDKSTFPPGRHVSNRGVSQSGFAEFPYDKTFEISLFNRETVDTIKVKEPKGYTIGYLMAEINSAVNPLGGEFDLEVSQLEFSSSNTGLMVKLSPEISQYLGITPDQWFHGDDMKVSANPYLVLYSPFDFILITCSCAQDQVYGDAMRPILRILPVTDQYNKEVQYTFSPIQYVGVADSEVSQIRVQIIDDQLRPLPVAREPSTIVLHFRQRPL